MESEQLNQFDLLLQKVDTLLAKCQELNRIKEELETLVLEKDREIELLKQNNTRYEQDKVQIRDKVDDILSKIDHFVTE